jgi:hypothetical protein
MGGKEGWFRREVFLNSNVTNDKGMDHIRSQMPNQMLGRE